MTFNYADNSLIMNCDAFIAYHIFIFKNDFSPIVCKFIAIVSYMCPRIISYSFDSFMSLCCDQIYLSHWERKTQLIVCIFMKLNVLITHYRCDRKWSFILAIFSLTEKNHLIMCWRFVDCRFSNIFFSNRYSTRIF